MKSMWGQDERFLRVKRKNYRLSQKAAKIIVLLIISLIGIIFIAGDVGLINLWSAKKKIKNLETRIESIQKENAVLNEKIKSLKTDPFEIEKVARERYGYLKPGERVYRFIKIPENPVGKKE